LYGLPSLVEKLILLPDVIYILLSGLSMTGFSVLFNFILNLKKMQKKYISLFMINAALIVIAISSCSKDNEDIAAPLITIIRPVENDTVSLTNGFVIIEVVANDNVDIHDMEMNVRDQAGNVIFSYDADDLEDHSYTCIEQFQPKGITEITRMKLTVTFENEYKNWESKAIDFYVKP
jgi:hypothetical protein